MLQILSLKFSYNRPIIIPYDYDCNKRKGILLI